MFHAITLLEVAKAKWLATQPPTPRVSWGLIVCVFTFAWPSACPRPKRFPIPLIDSEKPRGDEPIKYVCMYVPYYHVMNINTQGKW